MSSSKTPGYIYSSLDACVQTIRDGVHTWATLPKKTFGNETDNTHVDGSLKPHQVYRDTAPRRDINNGTMKNNYVSVGSNLCQMFPTLLPVLYKPKGMGQAMGCFGKYFIKNMGRQLAFVQKSSSNPGDN